MIPALTFSGFVWYNGPRRLCEESHYYPQGVRLGFGGPNDARMTPTENVDFLGGMASVNPIVEPFYDQHG